MFRVPCGRLVRGLPLVLALSPLAAAPAPGAGQEPHADAGGDLTLALAGDAIITRRLSVFDEPEFLDLRRIVQAADAAFVNVEILFHDYGPDVIPAAASGGTYMRADPELAEELTWMGFDLGSLANNHTMDFGAGGIRATVRATDEAGLVTAGAGENLAEALAPAFLETPRGRIALISVASTFDDAMRAGPQRKDLRGRPGLAPLRHRTIRLVPRATLEELRRIGQALDVVSERSRGDTLRFLGDTFIVGEDYATVTEPDEDDLAAILAAIRDAARQANWVIVSSHSHEGAGENTVPARFLVTFARAAVEAGADVFAGHGPHVLRGIEIHQGRPIFYSLANFVFQNETVELQPADNYLRYGLGPDALPGEFYDTRVERGSFQDPEYWESVLPVVTFRDGELEEIRLTPVTLGFGLPRPQRGRPLRASGDHATAILEGLAELSEPFGTRVRIEDGIGVIRAGDRATEAGRGRR